VIVIVSQNRELFLNVQETQSIHPFQSLTNSQADHETKLC